MPDARLPLVEKLKGKVRAQVSEQIVNPDDYVNALTEASGRHNPAYLFTADSVTIPPREQGCVVLLAWADMSLSRASAFAAQAQGNAPSGFGTDRNTPFYKLMELHKRVMDEYAAVCRALGLDVFADSSTVYVGDVITRDVGTNVRVPHVTAAGQPPPNATLVVEELEADGHITAKWSYRNFRDFSKVVLMAGHHAAANQPIIQDWINEKVDDRPPKVNPLMEIVGTFTDITINSARLNGLTTVGGWYYFLLCVQDTNGFWSYSNVVSLGGQPVP